MELLQAVLDVAYTDDEGTRGYVDVAYTNACTDDARATDERAEAGQGGARAGGLQAESVPAGEEPARGAHPFRGGGPGTARVGSLVVPAPARAGGGTAPLGSARARDA